MSGKTSPQTFSQSATSSGQETILNDRGSRGRLIGRFVASPVFLQRAAIIALLAFFFMIAMIAAFTIRGHFGYLLLAAAFFVLHIFTLTGIWMRRSDAVLIYESGIEFKRRLIHWKDIRAIDIPQSGSLILSLKSGECVILPETIDRRDDLARYVRLRISR